MFFRKWELIEEDRAMIRTRNYDLLGVKVTEKVLVNTYRRKKLNGVYVYKYVARIRIGEEAGNE